MQNRNVRSVVKGLSWRAFAAIDTAIVASVVMFVRTGHWDLHSVGTLVAGIVGMELATKTFLFAVHERIWERAPLTEGARASANVATTSPTWEAITAQMRREYGTGRRQEATE